MKSPAPSLLLASYQQQRAGEVPPQLVALGVLQSVVVAVAIPQPVVRGVPSRFLETLVVHAIAGDTDGDHDDDDDENPSRRKDAVDVSKISIALPVFSESEWGIYSQERGGRKGKLV
jgi:hypothetical protein